MTNYQMPNVLGQIKTEWDKLSHNWNNRSELTHIVTTAVLLSFWTYFIFDTSIFGMEHSLLISFIVVAPSVMFHEIMHVKVAKGLDYKQSRYVAYLPFLVLSSIIVLFFKVPFLLLPGFAAVLGNRFVNYPVEFYMQSVPWFKINLRNKEEEWALMALGGPIANIILILICMVSLAIVPVGTITALISTVLYVNFMLLVFNMLPIPIFDGSKVLEGNNKWFVITWGVIILLGVVTWLMNNQIGMRLLI